MSQEIFLDLPTVPLNEETLKKVLKALENTKNREDFIKKLPPNKSSTLQEATNKLAKYYKNESLVLVLGAGVSMAFDLPNWNTLLQKLMITTIEKEQNVSSVLSKLFTNIFSPSPLIAGRYLQKFYEDKELSFEEAVRKILYEQINLDKESKLMDEIVNFCVSPGKTPNLDSIITYNFDDILEQRLSKVGITIPFKSVFGIGVNPDRELPIFHVHGFLPQKGKLTSQNQITFGESIYHKQYIDIYSWNNIVQINKFRDSNCLFIGTSLTDPNTRRLLDIAKKQKENNQETHFVFKVRYQETKVRESLDKLLKEDKDLLNEKSITEITRSETVKLLIEIIERFEETDTSSFGVKTIWLNDWSEIPDTLREIRSKAA
jgi:hypothetical protein